MDPVGAGVHRAPPAALRVSAGGPVAPPRRPGSRFNPHRRRRADDGLALPRCPCFGIGGDGQDGFGAAGAEPMVNDVPANG